MTKLQKGDRPCDIKMSTKLKGNLLLLITAMAWGSGFAIRKLGSAAIPPMTFNALREFLGAIFLLPLLAYMLKTSGYLNNNNNRHHVLEYRRKKAIKGGIVCGALFTIGSMLQSLGLATVSAGKSGFITSLYVVLTPFVALIMGTRIKRKSLVCIAVALVGFGLLSLGEGLGNIHIGDVLLLAGAFGFAAHIVTVGEFVDKSNGLLIAVIQMIFLGIVGLAVSIPVEHPTWSQFVACLPALLLCAFVTCTIGNTAQIIGQRYTDATSAALIMGLESVFSVVFGAIILGEMLPFRELMGCLLIFLAVSANQIDFTHLKSHSSRA